MSVSGISGSSASGIQPSQNDSASRSDAFLSALQNVDPALADQLGAQIKQLRASGASPQQVGQAVRQTLSSLSPSDRAEVAKALQSVGGRHHHHHHHGPGATSSATAATAPSSATSSAPSSAPSPFALLGSASASGASADAAVPGSTLDVQA